MPHDGSSWDPPPGGQTRLHRSRNPACCLAPDDVGAPTPLRTDELADMWGVDVRHIYRLVHEKRIPFLKWGNLLRFDVDAIKVSLAERSVPVDGYRHRRGPRH